MNKSMKLILPILLIFTLPLFFGFCRTHTKSTIKTTEHTILNNQNPGNIKILDTPPKTYKEEHKNTNQFTDKNYNSKEPSNNTPTIQNTPPKSMKDVNITPGLQKYLDESWDGSYEKIDYRLKLFDKISECLGPRAPFSGKISMFFLFKMNRQSKIAIGTEGDEDNGEHQQIAFQITQSDLSNEDEQLFVLCARESHLQLTMDITKKLEIDAPKNILDDYFFHPITVTFPIHQDIIYWLLSHDGQAPSE
jgi:hypothetical protein